MNWIQALLIAAVITLLVYLLRSRRSAQARAWITLEGARTPEER